MTGSIYVYGADPQYDSPSEPHYCPEGAYLFAFIVVTIGYVSLALSLLAAVCHCAYNSSAVASRDQKYTGKG